MSNVRKEPSALLELPPELRNDVYRLVLCNGNPVSVTATNLPEPPLLAVCKQIRDEAVQIYYSENTFHIEDEDYECTALQLWTRRVSSLRPMDDCDAQERYKHTLQRVLNLQPNWPNLSKWLRLFYQREIIGHGPPQHLPNDVELDMRVVGGIFAMVEGMRGQPWSAVEKNLEAQHNILCAIDGRWA